MFQSETGKAYYRIEDMTKRIRHERDSRQSPSRSGEVSIISRQRFAGFREKVPFK